jgi:type VI secretion system secreted protein VgrG
MGIIPSTQARKPMEVLTPLGLDALLLTGFSGHEGLSQLFEFSLEVVADNSRAVPFDQLLGQAIVVRLELPGYQQRYFHGLCNQVSQGESDQHFTAYTLNMVPRLWLLTKKAQCRIFQQLAVPDILKGVLNGLDVAFELQGIFQPRDYCVQYRETDFNFLSRLMEEEGIYYFFKHTDKGHQLVLANSPGSHPDLQPGAMTYENVQGGTRTAERIYDWQKTQALCSGKYTLWDHHFELPHKRLQADKRIADSVKVGGTTHKLLVADNDKLEVFDYPGEYAQRFDGIDPGGAERPAELPKIYDGNQRTVAIRMEQETVTGLTIQGASNCRHFVSGHKMTVTTLLADTLARGLQLEGPYVLTDVVHRATQGAYRAGGGAAWSYSNTFRCIPFAQPFRPQRVTPKPVVQGTQTAVVVCSPEEEIEPDKYGRVKVKFHWDRRRVNDLSSSCWIRVGTPWAGKQWGMIHIPRVGQEVIVDFLEGDPDQPIIVGSVYNAENMPPWKLPEQRMVSGVKSNSYKGGGGYNEISFDDTKGKEKLTMHGQYDMNTKVLHDQTLAVGNNRSASVSGSDSESVGGSQSVSVGGKQTVTVKKDADLIVSEGARHVQVPTNIYQLDAKDIMETGKDSIYLTVGNAMLLMEPESLLLAVQGNSILIDAAGVTIKGLPFVKIN